MPPDVKARLQRGEPPRVLFDANVLLDVLLQRKNAVPAARALTFAEAGAVRGHVCASAFGVICHRGAERGAGRGRNERLLAADLMRLLEVLPLTLEVLTDALGYESLSFEDAQVAAAGDRAGIDAILTSDGDFLRRHDLACTPRDIVPLLEEHLGEQPVCRVVRVTPEGAFRVEIADPAGVWRQTLPLSRFPTEEEAARVAGLRWDE